jgi:hypothetical protein
MKFHITTQIGKTLFPSTYETKTQTTYFISTQPMATLGMLESLGKILSTQLPNTIIFKPYFQYLNKKQRERVQPCFKYN